MFMEFRSNLELIVRKLKREEPLHHGKKQRGVTASWEKGKLSEKGVFRNTGWVLGKRMLISLCKLQGLQIHHLSYEKKTRRRLRAYKINLNDSMLTGGLQE